MCLCPILVPNPSTFEADYERHGGDPVLVDHLWRNRCNFIAVPCRHCIECIKARSAEWSARLRSELEWERLCGHDCYFVTLTISPEYLGEFLTSGKVDKAKCSAILGKFFRTLKDAYRCVFRHWCIGEYGERYGRLHFHCLFFNPPVSLETDGVHLHYSKNGVRMGSSPVLRRYWKYGFNDSGKVGSLGAGCYVSKYLLKGSTDNNTLPPIITSRNVGKNPISIENSKEVLRKCIRDGIYTIPVVFGRHQKQYQIPFSWMKRKCLTSICDELSWNVLAAELLIRYAMTEYFGLDANDTTPDQRRVRLENIVGGDLSYHNPHDVVMRRFEDLINVSVQANDFFYGTDLEPF